MMMKILAPALVALNFSAFATSSGAAVYDFFWTGDPFEDLTMINWGSNLSLKATGTIEIDAQPGSSFKLGDILSTNILLSGVGFNDWTLTTWYWAGGTIADDGLSATFSTMGAPFYSSSPNVFGCVYLKCANAELAVGSTLGSYSYRYGTVGEALASMKMTTSTPQPPRAVPIPASLPLLAFGLGGLGLVARRKRKVS